MSDPTSTHPRPGASNTAIAILVVVALLVGVAGSLAIRTPGSVVTTASDGEVVLEPIRWQVPVAFPTTLPALGDNIVWVAEQAKLASGGMTELEVFEPGKLVPPLEITGAVRDRKVDAGYTWVGYDQGFIPSAPLFSAVPFGMEPWEYTAWWYEGGGAELAAEVYHPHRVHPILCGITGPETAGWFIRQIETLDDLDGLKIRFAGLGGRVLQELGASVTLLPSGEIFPALERAAIDATEFSMPAIDQLLGFDKIVKNNYFPGWHQTFTAFHLIVNLDVWSELRAGSQASVETACTAGVMRSLSHGEALQGPVIAEFPEKGVTARRLPEALLREIQAVTDEVLAAEAERDPLFRKVYESQQAFSAHYELWKQLGYLPRDF